MIRRRFLILLGLLTLTAPQEAAGESPGCAQARAIVAEIEEMYASGAANHEQILARLALARDLCASLGDAWKYSHCSAQALGRERDARFYGDKALFLGIKSLSCQLGKEESNTARATSAKPGPVREKYALVIGIGSFKDPKITPLQYAAKDARDIATVLKDPRWGRFDPANVILITDEQATRANILTALQQLILRAEEDDLVFLYVSSHGSPDKGQSDLRTIGYIVTHDAAYDSIFVEGLEYKYFSEKVALIKARRKVVFLDTCYSGQASARGAKLLFIEPAGVDSQTAKLFLSGEGSYVITSSRANEQSFESDTIQNSYFTYFLLQALSREGDPPTIQDVFGFLAHAVPAAVARDKGQPQHPEMVPADGAGDLRIGVASSPR